MGCDIHIITEIKKDGSWKYVEEVPEDFDSRNYDVFGALAGVRNTWNVNNFEPRGLPDDLSGRKFKFKSQTEGIKKMWETNSERVGLTAEGLYQPVYCSCFQREISREEFDRITKLEKENPNECAKHYAARGYSVVQEVKTYYVCVPMEGEEFVEKSYKEIYPNFNDFLKNEYEDDWDEEAKDYGYWNVDFDCEDYHTPSWLSLKDLLEKDFSDYYMCKCKVPKDFWEALKNSGAVIPLTFTEQESAVDDMRDIISEAFCPTVTISYPSADKKVDSDPLHLGVVQLKEIAEKYDVEPEDIRIVFAFDN